MRNIALSVTVSAFVAFCLISRNDVRAGEAAYVGKVSATINDAGKVEEVSLAAEDGKTYRIAPSGKGEKLGKEANGENAEVKGTLKTKKGKDGDEEWLNVSSFTVVFKGAVAVEKDGKKITKVTLGGVEVKMSAVAKKMAETAEGKNVTATGAKSTHKSGKEEVVVLTLKEFKIDGEEKK